jgi:hypothetical protein
MLNFKKNLSKDLGADIIRDGQANLKKALQTNLHQNKFHGS